MDDSATLADTWFYDIDADKWSSGPPMATARMWHSCKLITDCEDNKQVVVVGGSDSADNPYKNLLNSTEIYDVNSGTWSAGKKEFSVHTALTVSSLKLESSATSLPGNDYPGPGLFLHGATHYRDSFIITEGREFTPRDPETGLFDQLADVYL